MLRFVGGALAALLLMGAAMLVLNQRAEGEPKALPVLAPPPPAAAAPEPLPDVVPEASARTREEKRFDRYDKDRNGAITREEYLAQRRRAFAKLDRNGDGRLDFEEWAVRTTEKFAKADADRSGAMSRKEFATTAVRRKAPARRRDCPPVEAVVGEEG